MTREELNELQEILELQKRVVEEISKLLAEVDKMLKAQSGRLERSRK